MAERTTQIVKGEEIVAENDGWDLTSNGMTAKAQQNAPCDIVFAEYGQEARRMYFDGKNQLRKD